MSRAVLSLLGRLCWLTRLCGDGLVFKVVADRVPFVMGCQGTTQARELLVGLEASEALGGLEHGGGGPAQRHAGVLPAFDVAADPADGAVHVLDDVGAGERPAQFGRQAVAGVVLRQIGIASGRERVYQYVRVSGGDVLL